MSTSTKPHADPTFTTYSAQQAQEYAVGRSGYPSQLIQHILSHHREIGGQFNKMLDIGCGPGNSTRDLAKFFDHAIGVDPSEEMIRAAQAIGGRSKAGPITYIHSAAEVCEGVAPDSVDLITAAMSAHWFDMPRFWPTASRVLKSNGTVAFFNIYRMYVHPATPHASEVQRALFELELDILKPHTLPGNLEVMNGYRGIAMPWEVSQERSGFDRSSYERKVWNENGKPGADGSFFCGVKEQSLDDCERSVATSSAVTRWRAAHPDFALTDHDCVIATFAKIRSILGPHVKTISTVGPTILLILKKL